MGNLKSISKQLTKDIAEDKWLRKEISFVIDGSHNSGDKTYRHIMDALDTTKVNYGKRGNNLIAYVGNVSIQDIYDVNANQANSIYKYLNDNSKKWLSDTIKDLLENVEL